MPGKQAKILSDRQIEDLLFFAKTTRAPIRNKVIVLLSVKAGLRAAEIANLTWEMVIEPSGEVAFHIEAARPCRQEGQWPYRSSKWGTPRGSYRAETFASTGRPGRSL
jgi:hypothetical protein